MVIVSTKLGWAGQLANAGVTPTTQAHTSAIQTAIRCTTRYRPDMPRRVAVPRRAWGAWWLHLLRQPNWEMHHIGIITYPEVRVAFHLELGREAVDLRDPMGGWLTPE